MTREEEILLHRFESRVRQLIDLCAALKQENLALEKHIQTLETTVEAKKSEIESLQKQYADLKLAKIIDISDDDMKNTRSRINKMVHEIDKCIALLNI